MWVDSNGAIRDGGVDVWKQLKPDHRPGHTQKKTRVGKAERAEEQRARRRRGTKK